MIRKGIWLKIPRRVWPVPGRFSVAITLWPFVLCRDDYFYNKPLVAHENFHWKEARRCFVLPWYLAYVLLLPFGQGRNHPLEKMAYHIEDTIRYTEKKNG